MIASFALNFKRLFIVIFFAMSLLINSMTALAEDKPPIYVITSQAINVESLTKAEVIDLFMGRARVFPNGEAAEAVELDGESIDKERFYLALTGLSLPRVNAYWSRIRFSGRARPPKGMGSEKALIEYLVSNPGAVSYLSEEPDSTQLRVLYKVYD